MAPAFRADKRTLIRRVTFDLTGLPPTPDEVDRFLADTSPRAFERLVERLLASPHYGERWGRHWLDVVRYADTAGENSDFPIPQAWLYRNHVIEAFNRDQPYDQFLREQIAGDLLPAASQTVKNERVIATGFIALSRRFGSGADGEPHLTIEDTIETLGRSVLGLSLSCARCHDHKHDPVSTADYYGLYGIFASTRYPHPGSEMKNRQEGFVPLVPSEEVDAKLRAHQQKFTAINIEIARLEKQMVLLKKEGFNPAALQSEYDDAWKRRDELGASPLDIPTAYAVTEGSATNAHIQRRGDPGQPGPAVPRHFLNLLGGDRLPENCEGSGRLELSKWLTSPTNPLTARVMANRIWQHHFGRGIVATPNDFGTHGQYPSHPELLDWLATRFMESGWSIQQMHRLILGSATYQQASVAANPAALSDKPDPGGRLLGKFPRRRLDAEELRDALLSVSGQLDLTPGQAHPFPPEHTWEFTQHFQFNAVYETPRRSVYLMQQRIKKHPFLELFDGADPNSSTAERGVTTTPLQALFTMNDRFAHTLAAAFAGRLQRERPSDPSRVERAYQLTFARRPTGIEMSEALRFLDRARHSTALAESEAAERRAWGSYARVLLGSNEFIFLD
ncbi:MAG: hypothetical protein QOF48_1062 [Verrucomicrobiota bacterium]